MKLTIELDLEQVELLTGAMGLYMSAKRVLGVQQEKIEYELGSELTAMKGEIIMKTQDDLYQETQAIRYLIIKGGGMANKSKVEDILMKRHGISRMDAHDITNQIEYRNDGGSWFYLHPARWVHKNVPEPMMKDYPEIKEVE